MSALTARLRYFLEDALDEWRHSPGVNLLATATLASVLAVAGCVLVVLASVDAHLEAWRRDVRVDVYLEDSVTAQEQLALTARLRTMPGVSRVVYVPKGEALRRFRESFGDLADLPAELGTNPLPASLEAYLAPGPDAAREARAVLAALTGSGGVEEIRFDRAWLDRLDAVLGVAREAGGIAGMLVLAAVMFVMASVLRLAVYARRDEIEIMLLVGATPGFVRGPFLVAGLTQGIVAAAASLAAVEGVRRACLAWAGERPGALLDRVAGRALPPGLAALVVGVGAAVGLLGALLAVQRAARGRA